MKRKFISDRQRAANRANAAKSQGPVTPEGKAASRLNALKHGLTAQSIVLTTEDAAKFDELRDAYYQRLKPTDYLESDLVDDIVVVRWSIRRMRCIEHSHFELEILRPNPDPELLDFSPAIHTALAHRLLANNSNVLQLANRQVARLSREYHRLMRTFFDLRRDCPPTDDPQPIRTVDDVPIVNTQNEPIPISGHAAPSARFTYKIERVRVMAAGESTPPDLSEFIGVDRRP